MTNQQILLLYEQLKDWQDTSFPINVTYALMYNKQVLEPLYETIMNCRLGLIKEYAFIDGDHYEVRPECQERFVNEMQELLSYNENIQLKKIKLSDLSDTNISMQALENLMPIISEED